MLIGNGLLDPLVALLPRALFHTSPERVIEDADSRHASCMFVEGLISKADKELKVFAVHISDQRQDLSLHDLLQVGAVLLELHDAWHHDALLLLEVTFVLRLEVGPQLLEASQILLLLLASFRHFMLQLVQSLMIGVETILLGHAIKVLIQDGEESSRRFRRPVALLHALVKPHPSLELEVRRGCSLRVAVVEMFGNVRHRATQDFVAVSHESEDHGIGRRAAAGCSLLWLGSCVGRGLGVGGGIDLFGGFVGAVSHCEWLLISWWISWSVGSG
mmetsp:Transcript_22344/g.62329  ORF Transcript_22344/g.62329 Transcript_22344/m.62329 type:complete len:274 (+) Transcript_22344:382-1203(+)